MRFIDLARRLSCCATILAALLAVNTAAAAPSDEPAAEAQREQEGTTVEVPRSQWEVSTELGAGYDTNANGSTSVQSFLGFPLDPRYVATASGFAHAGLSVQHTLNLSPDSGFVSTMQLSHRVNPEASFADQTIAALGTEGVINRGASRFSAAIGGYTSWLHGLADERGANLDLNAAHEEDKVSTVFTLRASRIDNGQRDFEDLEVYRYLAALSFTRSEVGSRSASIGLTLVAGHDSPLRSGSLFANDRIGAQLSADWRLREGAQAYVQVSALRSDYRDPFFGLDRKDDQLSAAVAVELSGWVGESWVLAPQLQYVRNASTVSLFEYDRLEAVLYLRRAL